MIGLDDCHRRRGQDGRAGPQPITGVSPARQKTPAVSPRPRDRPEAEPAAQAHGLRHHPPVQCGATWSLPRC